MFLLALAAILAESILDSPARPREGPGEIVYKQEETWLGFSSKRNRRKKVNYESKKIERKVKAADKGYILTISMNQPYLFPLKKQHQPSAEISL